MSARASTAFHQEIARASTFDFRAAILEILAGCFPTPNLAGCIFIRAVEMPLPEEVNRELSPCLFPLIFTAPSNTSGKTLLIISEAVCGFLK